jgi:transcriptional regulator GlxA family with amidase domain
MHFVIYLPAGFYSAMASTIVESLQIINDLGEREPLSFEFVSTRTKAISRSGIVFTSKRKPGKKMDVLILLTGLGSELTPTPALLAAEARRVAPLLKQAVRQKARIATTCGAAWLLASSGILDGKRATISWWLKQEVRTRFPAVKWEPSRMIVRDGRIYTSGGGLSGLELISTLLTDLGYAKQERRMRKIMVMPPARSYQSPYEMQLTAAPNTLETQLIRLTRDRLADLDVPLMARELGLSSRTLSRKFYEELRLSPGKWIQQKRMEKARALLEETRLSIAEICYQVGYEDPSSFSRLFARTTGMGPVEFRKELTGKNTP